ncbi:antibiotic biosynthesis monooxygenase family protein [Fredinandcohnia sp. 179-A 10B2 NHS]|uniref:antibiotic biosynthesis monooxygenase family protein n=1 Tax=Fredinandcohnia sp. 179-A 10B2 NHS TaxID=3235176 RepID=UPI0039A15ED8
MNFFIAFGTVDFLEKLKRKYKNEKMFEFYNNETAILLHETNKKKSVFAMPKKYEVISGYGELGEARFVVLTYAPVTEEGKPLFEYNFNQPDLFRYLPGIVSLRVLRPVKHDTYLILTAWNKESFYTQWKQSASYNEFEQLLGNTKVGIEQTIFSGGSYTKSYYAFKYEE